jgi:hypothetical protein
MEFLFLWQTLVCSPLIRGCLPPTGFCPSTQDVCPYMFVPIHTWHMTFVPHMLWSYTQDVCPPHVSCPFTVTNDVCPPHVLNQTHRMFVITSLCHHTEDVSPPYKQDICAPTYVMFCFHMFVPLHVDCFSLHVCPPTNRMFVPHIVTVQMVDMVRTGWDNLCWKSCTLPRKQVMGGILQEQSSQEYNSCHEKWINVTGIEYRPNKYIFFQMMKILITRTLLLTQVKNPCHKNIFPVTWIYFQTKEEEKISPE